MQASTCDAKASFSSTQSRSESRKPARARALRDAGIGPRPIQDGSTPALAAARIRARGRAPIRCACDSAIITRQAAPSLSVEELPAVALAPLLKGGLRAPQRF